MEPMSREEQEADILKFMEAVRQAATKLCGKYSERYLLPDCLFERLYEFKDWSVNHHIMQRMLALVEPEAVGIIMQSLFMAGIIAAAGPMPEFMRQAHRQRELERKPSNDIHLN